MHKVAETHSLSNNDFEKFLLQMTYSRLAFLNDSVNQEALSALGIDTDALFQQPEMPQRVRSAIEHIYAYEEEQKAAQAHAATKADRFGYIRAWPIERDTGQFVSAFAQYIKPQLILECGTSFGLSTIHWASALQMNSSGKVITVEVSKLKHAAAWSNFELAGVQDFVEQEKLAFDQYLKKCQLSFDIVFLDCDRSRYAFYFEQLKPHLHTGSFILADNAIDRGADMLSFKENLERDADFITRLLPIGDGLLIAKKVG